MRGDVQEYSWTRIEELSVAPRWSIARPSIFLDEGADTPDARMGRRTVSARPSSWIANLPNNTLVCCRTHVGNDLPGEEGQLSVAVERQPGLVGARTRLASQRDR